MEESDLGMFVEKAIALVTAYDVSPHKLTPEETEEYLEQIKMIPTTMIPAILAEKDVVATQDEKLFKFLQGHIRKAFKARRRTA